MGRRSESGPGAAGHGHSHGGPSPRPGPSDPGRATTAARRAKTGGSGARPLRGLTVAVTACHGHGGSLVVSDSESDPDSMIRSAAGPGRHGFRVEFKLPLPRTDDDSPTVRSQ
jgi:hypothetical protein